MHKLSTHWYCGCSSESSVTDFVGDRLLYDGRTCSGNFSVTFRNFLCMEPFYFLFFSLFSSFSSLFLLSFYFIYLNLLVKR